MAPIGYRRGPAGSTWSWHRSKRRPVILEQHAVVRDHRIGGRPAWRPPHAQQRHDVGRQRPPHLARRPVPEIDRRDPQSLMTEGLAGRLRD
jgi:hypothetical protein